MYVEVLKVHFFTSGHPYGQHRPCCPDHVVVAMPTLACMFVIQRERGNFDLWFGQWRRDTRMRGVSPTVTSKLWRAATCQALW